MSFFHFATDSEAEAYCVQIAEDMADIFGVSLEKAVELVNQQWQGARIVGENGWIYHESPATWATRIYRRLHEGKGW